MDDDVALQCPSSRKACDFGDCDDLIIDNWVRCVITGRIIENGTSPTYHLVQTGQKLYSHSNDNIYFINDDKEDLVVETDSDEDIS